MEADAPGTSGGTKPADRPHRGDKAGSNGKGPVSGMPCTYKLADPQPPAGSMEWVGHAPGDGAVYEKTCAPGKTDAAITQLVWAATPPAARVDPAVVAQQAVDKMKLAGPDVASPRATGSYAVGVPMWLWVNRSASTYGPNSASATAGGVTVMATAKVTKIVWSMGDGRTVTCTSAGTPYKPSLGKRLSPDCGHVYRRSSKNVKGGAYRVAATSTWVVDWRVTGGGGETGQITETRSSQLDVVIGQVKVLN
ncbi:ATP/GTP-binding protein [Streptomyces sp. NPDC059118]|uniref:ATP/GTP-binding protein n=1 Tax=unclassified Streptomyces TaxID=2593676 RepID=UPI003687C1E1